MKITGIGHRTLRMSVAGIIFVGFLCMSRSVVALDADDFSELVGFTIVATTNVTGDFEGADFDKQVALDNGMIFTFSTYSYTYSYRPSAVILARTFTIDEMRHLGVKPLPTQPITTYKLIIDDEIYDVRRVR